MHSSDYHMNQTVFHYEEKCLLLTPVIKLKGGEWGKNKKSQERERDGVKPEPLFRQLQMPMSQSAKDNMLVSKQAVTVTYFMECSQATPPQLSEPSEAKFTQVLFAY